MTESIGSKISGRIRMNLFIRAMVLMLTAASWASAQTRNFNTPAALVGYTGADREKILFEGAKSEGKVVLVYLFVQGFLQSTC
jgi:hypothetical protein